MEATLEGEDVNVRIRMNKLPNGEFISWLDSLADDCIHCQLNNEFEVMSFYKMTSCYKKVLKHYNGEQRQI